MVERFFDAPVPTAAFGITFHAPSLYIIGMLSMELLRRDGRLLSVSLRIAGRSIISNPMMLGILAGVAVNPSGCRCRNRCWLPSN
ncbi:MAG: hypothetical protein R3E95_05070 [Thiolinea sp.]